MISDSMTVEEIRLHLGLALKEKDFVVDKTGVKTIEIIICKVKQLPNIFSAVSLSFLPINIEARGAPPLLINAANAETIIIKGRQTPTPVKAKSPISSIWPINILSTTLYNILIN